MGLAQQSGVQKRELLTRGKLTGTGITGETCQVIDSVFSSPHPIPSAHTAPAFRAFRAECSAKNANSRDFSHVKAARDEVAINFQTCASVKKVNRRA